MKNPGKIIFSLIASMVFWTGVSGQTVKKITKEDLVKLLNNQDDKLHIVNFWATWCAPCVRELPSFEKLSRAYDPGTVSFTLISLDFPEEFNNQLIPFLKKNKISVKVELMQDLDYNDWIETVDPGWYGNLPATLLFNNPKKIRIFHPGEIDETGLRNLINENLN